MTPRFDFAEPIKSDSKEENQPPIVPPKPATRKRFDNKVFTFQTVTPSAAPSTPSSAPTELKH